MQKNMINEKVKKKSKHAFIRKIKLHNQLCFLTLNTFYIYFAIFVDVTKKYVNVTSLLPPSLQLLCLTANKVCLNL